MSEESRLGREQIETAYTLKQITDAGVRVFFYLEDRERTLGSALDKVMLSLTNFAAEVERERASQRTYDAMVRKAKALHVTGGKVFGYNNVEVLGEPGPDGRQRRLHVLRTINDEQAAIVRRIFAMYESGLGMTRVGKTLNDERVASPRGDRTGWAPTAIREILYRELYRGVIVWNRSQKIVRGGTKKQRRGDPKEWLRLDAPDLRIVAEERWQRAHARLARQAAMIERTNHDGRLQTRPASAELAAKHLLTGLARCAACGGPLIALTRPHGRQRVGFYGCGYNYKRGAAICSNTTHVREDLVDRAVMTAITDALDHRVLTAAIDRALDRLQTGQEHVSDRRGRLQSELLQIEAQERRLVDAVARGEGLEPLLARLKAEGERKQVVRRELETLPGANYGPVRDRADMKREFLARIADAKAFLARHTLHARQILRKLLTGPYTSRPSSTRGRGRFAFGLKGVTRRCSLEPCHPWWWPQRDSNPCFSLERAVSWASRRWGRAERDSNLHEICWLGEEDSNPRYVVQSHASYH